LITNITGEIATHVLKYAMELKKQQFAFPIRPCNAARYPPIQPPFGRLLKRKTAYYQMAKKSAKPDDL